MYLHNTCSHVFYSIYFLAHEHCDLLKNLFWEEQNHCFAPRVNPEPTDQTQAKTFNCDLLFMSKTAGKTASSLMQATSIQLISSPNYQPTASTQIPIRLFFHCRQIPNCQIILIL